MLDGRSMEGASFPKAMWFRLAGWPMVRRYPHVFSRYVLFRGRKRVELDAETDGSRRRLPPLLKKPQVGVVSLNVAPLAKSTFREKSCGYLPTIAGWRPPRVSSVARLPDELQATSPEKIISLGWMRMVYFFTWCRMLTI